MLSLKCCLRVVVFLSFVIFLLSRILLGKFREVYKQLWCLHFLAKFCECNNNVNNFFNATNE